MSDQKYVSFSLTVKNGNAALAFYAAAFGAKELYRMMGPNGGIAHAEFMLGHTRVFLSEEASDWNACCLPPGYMSPCLFMIHVPDCDAAYKKAIAANAQVLKKPESYWWGERSAMFVDADGYRWSISQKVEELLQEDVKVNSLLEMSACL